MASPTSILAFATFCKTPSGKRLWIAQLVSIFGDFLAVFAVFSVVTFQLHGTPTQVSMILAAYLLAAGGDQPARRRFVDKWNVKWTMIASDLIRGLLVLALLFVRDLNAIYGIFFALSTVSSFFMPAQSVAVRTLAPRRRTDGRERADVAGHAGRADHQPGHRRPAGAVARRQLLLPFR